MAEQEFIEWQPGPNRKLDLSGAASSLVVVVTWSGDEDYFKNNAQVDEEIIKLQKAQDGDETASSVESLPDLVENMKPETYSSTSVDATEDQMIEERSTNTGMVESSAKDYLDEWQTEVKGIVTGYQDTIAASRRLNVLKAVSPLAIPESWYGEESEETSCHDSTEASAVSLEDIVKGETTSSAFKFTSDSKEEENGEKLMPLNGPDEMISEGRTGSTTLSIEFEPITRDEKDELLTTEVESITKDELRVCDVPFKGTSQRNVATLLPDTELEDIKEENSEKHIVQNGSIEGIAEVKSEMMISTTVSNNEDQRDNEVLVDNDPSVVTAEVPEIETPRQAMDSLENVEMKPAVTAKEKKWGHKGWLKLWGAFVHGRNIDET